nr:MAG TPA: hypothetical protein [Caudoviricetes sp.]
MRLDEMIIKANADGKVYVHEKDQFTYSKFAGFLSCDKSTFSLDMGVYIDGWEELPKRHLTVSEAEKELDCEIDTPDISKLFRPMIEHPDNKGNVIVIDKASGYTHHCGFYDKDEKWWRWYSGCNPCISNPSLYYWIDPADLIKLLPKE